MSSHQDLSRLADGKRLLTVEGTVVPAPPGAEHPGKHLFVNCLYSPDIIQASPKSVLAQARADTVRILQTLVTNAVLEDVVSVCVTFLARIHPTDHPCRLYRYSILTSGIARDENAIGESCFALDKGGIQSSDHDQIAGLLYAEAPLP